MPLSRFTRFVLALGVCASIFGTALMLPAESEPDLYVDPARLEEWNDWRFGLFIYWAPWSQREVGYIWKMVNEESPEVGSKSFDLWETFNPTEFDPAKWAKAPKMRA